MKKRLVLMLGLTAMLLVMNGCRMEDGLSEIPPPEEEAILLRARNFLEFEAVPPVLPDVYYREGQPNESKDGATRSMFSDCLSADWSKAKTYSDEEVSIIEVPLRLVRPVYYSVLVEEAGEEVSRNRELPYTLLVVNEYKHDGSARGALVTLLPDASYEKPLTGLQADPSGSDFTGIAIYSTLDGMPLFGIRYENGAATKILGFGSDKGLPVDPTLKISLGAEAEDTPTRGVNDLNELDPVVVIAYPPDPVTIIWPLLGPLEYSVLILPEGGGGQNNGGSSKPPTNTGQNSWDAKSKKFVYDPSKNYKFALNKTPEQLAQYGRNQLHGKTCALHSAAYVNAQLGTTNTSVTTFEKAYINYEYNRTGIPVPTPTKFGCDISFMPGFIDSIFNTVPFTSFNNALSSGYPVIISIQDPYGGMGHDVVVVGITGDSLIYMDSAYGELREIKESDVPTTNYKKVIKP